jgi:hypothetical protein
MAVAPFTAENAFASHDLVELKRLIGSQNGIARVLARPESQISRWFDHPERIRPAGLRLLSDARAVATRAAEVYGGIGQIEVVLITRRPELGWEVPAEYIRAGRAGELLEKFDELGHDEQGLDADDDALVSWFADAFSGENTQPASLSVAQEDEEEFDEPLARGEWLSTAWRGGGTMSSARWSGA